MELSKEIQTFVSKLLNSRGKLLTAKIGNTSDPILIKHERLKKAFEHAKAEYKTDIAWSRFIEKHEAVIKYLIIGGKCRAKYEAELFLMIIKCKRVLD